MIPMLVAFYRPLIFLWKNVISVSSRCIEIIVKSPIFPYVRKCRLPLGGTLSVLFPFANILQDFLVCTHVYLMSEIFTRVNRTVGYLFKD